MPITTADELSRARLLVTEWANQLAFGTLERTKLVTAASELGRNMLVHAGGGAMTIQELLQRAISGLRLVFEDKGPGIADMALAMTDGYSTAKSMGLGLGGARRLVNEFDIVSAAGQGTRITVTQWKRR